MADRPGRWRYCPAGGRKAFAASDFPPDAKIYVAPELSVFLLQQRSIISESDGAVMRHAPTLPPPSQDMKRCDLLHSGHSCCEVATVGLAVGIRSQLSRPCKTLVLRSEASCLGREPALEHAVLPMEPVSEGEPR